MAVGPQKPKSRKNQQIEPLDWSTMSQSPALKGMVSFLEVTPEDIRRQQGRNGDSRSGSDTSIGSDSLTGSDLRMGSDSIASLDGKLDQKLSFRSNSEALAGGESRIGSDKVIGSDTGIGSDASTDKGISPGFTGRRAAPTAMPVQAKTTVNVQPSPSYLGTSTSDSAAHAPSFSEYDDADEISAVIRKNDTRIGSETLTGKQERIRTDIKTVSVARIGSESSTGSGPRTVSNTLIGIVSPSRAAPVATASDSRIGGQPKPTYFVGTDQYPRPQRRMPMLQGDVVWQNRKIRKCILAQDAHSQGEDALFSTMWNAAKPDAADPSGSRTLRIGYAELSQKSRMHRSNIRINIAGLRAKLAIEVLDEHDSRDVMPRLYRLYSYKEILERRRAAGLEYVIRKKSVVFVTETGEIVPLPGLPKPSVRKTQKALVESNGREAVDLPAYDARAEQLDLDVRQISDAMSQHWPVDEAAAQQLLRQCRSVRRDAEIGEIVFFINEKLQIALTNKNIKNPTGLILATVPQCFEGATFQEFRRRRNEALRLAAEEQERKRQQERDLEAWLNGKMQELRAVADDDSQSEAVRDKARRELKHYGA